MIQISEQIFLDGHIGALQIPNKILPNPYYEVPFLIIHDFFSPSEALEVSQVTLHSGFSDAKIRTLEKDAALNERVRKTKIYDIAPFVQGVYDRAFALHKQTIENYFAKVILSSTTIQALGYHEGSFYKAHSDDSSFMVDADGVIVGFKLVAPHRKITTVCFANDDFIGGELVFNFLRYADGSQVVYKPKAGDLVAFLSNSIFTHEVQVVTKGDRLTLVQWHDCL